MEIKKFEEFIKEGFWKPGIERAKNGEVRKEDKLPDFFQKDYVYPVEGYKGYFFEVDAKNYSCGIEVYHAPDDVLPKWKYIDIDWVDDRMRIESVDTTEEDLDELSDEEIEVRDDNDFIEAINTVLYSLPDSVFEEGEW